MGQILKELCRRFEVELVEGHVMADHVHMCVAAGRALTSSSGRRRNSINQPEDSIFHAPPALQTKQRGQSEIGRYGQFEVGGNTPRYYLSR
jgi:REP element-mobilizing transposase RayT